MCSPLNMKSKLWLLVVMLQMLRVRDKGLRSAARTALKQIDPEQAAKAGVR
jgi:hypothetical protein